MIDPLLHALVTSDLPLSAEELADAVWLASFMDTSIEYLAATKPLKLPMLPDVEQQVGNKSKDNQKGVTVNDKATKEFNGSSAPSRANVHLHDPLTSSIHREGGVRAASFRFPSATALPGK
ncbi:MAG: hypothetical protein KDE31_23825, partial [Caldilineaceae bacterium]|nr:hypothetical protein [Caldilineaceae bacterium]